jgi:hypothetical protein
MKIFVLILLGFLSINLIAKEIKYPVFEIPEDLKAGSNAVIREYKIEKEIVSPSLVKTTTTFVITIFNKSAQELGYFREAYDEQSSIRNYKLTLYNQVGEQMDKDRGSDFNDVAAFDGFSLFTGVRLVFNRAFSNNFPYTIEYSFIETQKQTLGIGEWNPCLQFDVAVQNSTFTLTYPSDFELRIKETNLQKPAETSNINGKIIRKWELNNFKPIKSEIFMPKTDILPSVEVAADKFYYDDVPGNLSDWKAYGGWSWGLIKDRSELSETTIAKLKQMTDGLPNDREKIKVLYKYLQDNTRYVNVSLGIGGFQPFSALDVDEQKYGDCKALSNYMRSMLKAIGILSNYTVIMAGEYAPDLDLTFTSQQMNHVILCVPNNGDTIWLECTNQRQPFAFPGSFTDDRYAMIVSEEGGKMVRTHRFTRDVNTLVSKVDMQISPEGTASLKSSETAKAIQYENFEPFFYLDAVEQKKALYENLNIPNLTINSYSFEKTDGPLPTATRKMDATIIKYATINGQRMMFAPKVIDRFEGNIENIKERKYPVVLTSEFTDYDTISIALPQGYKVEFLPEPQDMKTLFGEFKSQFIQNGNQLQYTRYLTKWKGTYEPAKYQELRDFMRKVTKIDENKVVLIKE